MMIRTALITALAGLFFSFPVSAKTLVVDPGGDDQNAGTPEAPLRTISRGAELAQPGDTVLVHAGVYRERVAPARGGEPDRPITYRAAPGKRVFVRGSEVWAPDWREEGRGVFSAVPDDAMFDDRSPEYLDGYNPLKVELASTPWGREGRREVERRLAGETRIHGGDERIVYTCGQVFIDGEELKEVPLREELVPKTWWYEPKSERVFVHFGELLPSEHEIELTTRRRLFAPKKRGLGHIVLEGFIFEHCGNQYPTNFWIENKWAQKGAVGLEAGHDWTIRRNVVRRCKTFAIDAGRVGRFRDKHVTSNNLIEENYLVENGSAGIMMNSSENMVVRRNVILRNNHLRFGGIKRWEQAAIKAHSFRNGLIESNYLAYNHDTYGVWLDNQFPDSRVTRNVIHDNGVAGVFLEMSDYDYDKLLVDNNVIFGNKTNGVYIHDASGGTFLNNLIAGTGGGKSGAEEGNNGGHAIFIHQVTTRTRSRHHSFFNNLVTSNANHVEVAYPAGRAGPQRFDHNLYGVGAATRDFTVNYKCDKPVPMTAAEFKAAVLSDLSLGDDVAERFEGGKAHLTLDEWRSFWEHHDCPGDAHSVLDPSSEVRYDADSYTLSVSLQADPVKVGSVDYDAVSSDFFGKPLPTEGKAKPGPFQDLKRGKNQFVVWDGLPVLAEGELPPADWTR